MVFALQHDDVAALHAFEAFEDRPLVGVFGLDAGHAVELQSVQFILQRIFDDADHLRAIGLHGLHHFQVTAAEKTLAEGHHEPRDHLLAAEALPGVAQFGATDRAVLDHLVAAQAD